jgi:hypothetical protein
MDRTRTLPSLQPYPALCLALLLQLASMGCGTDSPEGEGRADKQTGGSVEEQVDAYEASGGSQRCDPDEDQPSSCTCGQAKGQKSCSAAGKWSSCVCPKNDAGTPRDAGAKDPVQTDPPADDEAEQTPAPDGKSSASSLPCDVAAVLSEHCSECHGEKLDFGAPMSLVSWQDLIAERKGAPTHDAVLARVRDDDMPMPPAPYARLSAAEIAVLTAWVEDGAKAGDESCKPAESAPDEEYTVPPPDDCEETYELKAHDGDDAASTDKFKISKMPALEGNQYHCFYFDPPYTSDAGMYWFQPILDNTPNLHHWILYATDHKTHASGTSAGCNAAEPGAYFVAGWAPGANNTSMPKDVSLALPSGPSAGLILEVHYYNNTGKVQEDASGIRFCTGKKSKREHVAAVHTLGSEAICIEPGAKREVSGMCAPRTDMGDIHITGMWPHMHKLARRMVVNVKRKGGAVETIHDAPFDFNAQIFHDKKDIVIKPGDTLETRCFFENDTQSRVHYGERTQDEMCYAFIVAWPAGALATAPSPLADPSTELLNRCGEQLSILQSCNGLADRPVNAEHP